MKFFATLLIFTMGGPMAVMAVNNYLLSSFNNGEQKLRIFQSTNAVDFYGYHQGIAYTPPAGNSLRDPSIIYHQGHYYICHTAGNFGAVPYFSIIVSTDLKNWSHFVNVPMTGIAGIQRTWAPEWFRDDDGSLHILVSASKNTNDISNHHIIYTLHSLDANDLSQWSVPEPVTGLVFASTLTWTGEEIPRMGFYDAYIVKRGSTYFMFYFNASSNYIELASSSALVGPYTQVRNKNWLGIGIYKEGPSVIYLGGGRWRLYFADQIYSYLSYVDSTNNWATWSLPQQLPLPDSPPPSQQLPRGYTLNHGTVLIPPGGMDLEHRVSVQEGEMSLSFYAEAGDTYNIAQSSNLTNWTPLTTVSPTNTGSVVQPLNVGTNTKQFWRVERLLPN